MSVERDSNADGDAVRRRAQSSSLRAALVRARRAAFPARWAPTIRRMDQAVLAVIAAASLAAMIGYWAIRGGFSGQKIDFERAEPIETRFWVDVNQAGWAELAQIPGVGESLARRIVESREKAGPFIDHDDLRRIRGIGPRTLESMRPYLRPLAPAANVAGP